MCACACVCVWVSLHVTTYANNLADSKPIICNSFDDTEWFLLPLLY